MKKVRHRCALVHKPYQDQPCAGCPDQCGRRTGEGMLLWMAARLDYVSVLAGIWKKKIVEGEYAGYRVCEIALMWGGVEEDFEMEGWYEDCGVGKGYSKDGEGQKILEVFK